MSHLTRGLPNVTEGHMDIATQPLQGLLQARQEIVSRTWLGRIQHNIILHMCDCHKRASPVLTLQPHHVWLIVIAWDVGTVIDEAQPVVRPGRVYLQGHVPPGAQCCSAD